MGNPQQPGLEAFCFQRFHSLFYRRFFPGNDRIGHAIHPGNAQAVFQSRNGQRNGFRIGKYRCHGTSLRQPLH